jgi:hypothetical protein
MCGTLSEHTGEAVAVVEEKSDIIGEDRCAIVV